MPEATGQGIAIVYGGYTAQLTWVESWATELWKQRLAALGVGHVYAVQGPKDDSYSAQEIANSALARHLLERLPGPDAPIIVAAHSSGSFVAHELFGHLFVRGLDPEQRTRGRIVYYNLEGGGLGLDEVLVGSLKRAYFVTATDPVTKARAQNAGTAESLGATYPSAGGTLMLEVPDSGCAATAGRWCLHDAVVNTRPMNPTSYDLEHDYQLFSPAPRAVQTGWLDRTAADFGL
jgi:hypothetical protein